MSDIPMEVERVPQVPFVSDVPLVSDVSQVPLVSGAVGVGFLREGFKVARMLICARVCLRKMA